MITVAALIACGVQPTQAKLFAPYIDQTCKRFDIWSPMLRAAFIAQAMHESMSFTRMEESLYYRSPDRIRGVWPSRFKTAADAAHLIMDPKGLANAVYSNRLGNGDPASGEGWKYRGRGIFMLTGCANYMVAGDALGQDFKRHPELVSMPEHAAMTAGWFWKTRGCNEAMTSHGLDATSQLINGGMVGAADRRELYSTCREVIQ